MDHNDQRDFAEEAANAASVAAEYQAELEAEEAYRSEVFARQDAAIRAQANRNAWAAADAALPPVI